MAMRNHHIGILVEIFNAEEVAQAAVQQLKAAGFSESQIIVAFHDWKMFKEENGTELGEHVTAGAAAGLGVGTLWGLGILAGIIPGFGPAIAGGTLGVLLSSAAAAATAGTARALIGLRMSHDEGAKMEEDNTGYTIVTVKAGSRADIADAVLSKFNRSDRISSQAT